MTVQATMFFTEQVGAINYGWSETHYLISATALPAALTALTSLAQLRANLCGAGVLLPYLRVSSPEVFRDSQITEGIFPNASLLINPGGANQIEPLTIAPGAPDGSVVYSGKGLPLNNTRLSQGMVVADYEDLIADQPEVGLMLRLEGGTTYVNRRSYLIRGLPDGVTFTNAPGVVASNSVLCRNWLSALNKFITALSVGSQWGMRVNASAGVITSVTSWAVGAAPQYQVTMTVPSTFSGAVGNRCRVSQVAVQYPDGSVRNYAGSLTIASISAPSGSNPRTVTFYTRVRGSAFMNSPILGGNVVRQGIVTLYTASYLPYTNVVVRRWASRKAGIPFDLQRSRVRKRA